MTTNDRSQTKPDHRLSIAPMLDWTDRHYRYFMRGITRQTLLYTEMITTGALLHREPGDFLDYDPQEHPLALQLGGSDPNDLARCCAIADQWGYDEINLNVGCPSDRVQNGRFGACLMASPELVADCVSAMSESSSHPITVKHRIGIDDIDSYEALSHFVQVVSLAGCQTFIVHARKAWLQGLSPKQNREIPPLRYETVHRLKQDFPELEIVINGGFKDLQQVKQQLTLVDGVMIGREAYQHPWQLAAADQQLYGAAARASASPHQAVQRMLPYIEQHCSEGTPVNRITRHMLGIFQGVPGAKAWRRHLSEHAHRKGVGPEVVEQALAYVQCH